MNSSFLYSIITIILGVSGAHAGISQTQNELQSMKWTVTPSVRPGYSFEYSYKGCHVEVRDDYTGVVLTASIQTEGRLNHQVMIIEKNKDGNKTLTVVDNHYSERNKILYNAEYDVFHVHCRTAAVEGLPNSVRKAFQGYYLDAQ